MILQLRLIRWQLNNYPQLVIETNITTFEYNELIGYKKRELKDISH